MELIAFSKVWKVLETIWDGNCVAFIIKKLVFAQRHIGWWAQNLTVWKSVKSGWIWQVSCYLLRKCVFSTYSHGLRDKSAHTSWYQLVTSSLFRLVSSAVSPLSRLWPLGAVGHMLLRGHLSDLIRSNPSRLREYHCGRLQRNLFCRKRIHQLRLILDSWWGAI